MQPDQQKTTFRETLRHALAWLIVLSGLTLAGGYLTIGREWVARIVGAASIAIGVLVVRRTDETEKE